MGFYDRFLCILGCAVAITVLTIAVRLNPDPRGVGTHEQLGLPPCAFLIEHGIPCVSCGMTTAFTAMAHLRPGLAWQANPFGILLFLATLVTPFHCARCFWRRRGPLAFLSHPRAQLVLPLLGVGLLLNWGLMILLYRAHHPQ